MDKRMTKNLDGKCGSCRYFAVEPGKECTGYCSGRMNHKGRLERTYKCKGYKEKPMPDYPTRELIVRETDFPDATRQEVVGELVRCKDCKFSNPWYRDKSRCFLWYEEGIDVFNDGYCSYGKRKDDEMPSL